MLLADSAVRSEGLAAPMLSRNRHWLEYDSRRACSAVRRHRICSVDRVGHLKSVASIRPMLRWSVRLGYRTRRQVRRWSVTTRPTPCVVGALAGLPAPTHHTSRESRERKSGKWLVRQQPECKEKHRNGQRRANHEQRREFSKLSATHEMQRQR